MPKIPNSGSKYHQKKAKANRQKSSQVQSNLPKSDSVKESDIIVTNPNLNNLNTESLSQSQAISSNEPKTNPRDLDRSRASAAWSNIQTMKTLSFQAKYGSLARKIPTLIQVNGLGQTLAFLKAKVSDKNPDDRHSRMFNHISDWVCTRLNSGSGNLLNRVLDMDSQTYRFATAEALAFLQWIKRFAEAELGSEEE